MTVDEVVENSNLMVVLDKNAEICGKITRLHPLVIVNICTKSYGN